MSGRARPAWARLSWARPAWTRSGGRCCTRRVELPLVLGIMVVGVALILVVSIWTLRALEKARSRRRELLESALGEVGETVVVNQETGAAAGRVRGFSVRFAFLTRGAGSSSEAWTEVEVDVEHEPLVLGVRRQGRREERLIEEGLAIDVEVGEPVIDGAYLIEGAPAAVVKRLFPAAVCAKLGAVDPDEVETRAAGLRVAKRGWKEDQASVAALVDLAVSLAEQVEPAITETENVEAPKPRSAYRGDAVSAEEKERWRAARREMTERQAAELANLEATRVRRGSELRARLGLVVGAVLAVVALVWCAAYMMM